MKVTIQESINLTVQETNTVLTVSEAARVIVSGNDTEVQFNDGGSLAGASFFTLDKDTSSATLSGNFAVTGTVDGRDIAADGSKLDGIENNAKDDQTGPEILSLLLDEDGAGSGLDADLLDGQHGSYFLDYTNFTGTPPAPTLDIVTTEGNTTTNAITVGNITTTGYIRGPSTFILDPATHGDDTGTLVVAGNLQVDGTTTTINSTELTVDDLNIVVASGAADAAAANGAGITIDGANASLTYDASEDTLGVNKPFVVSSTWNDAGTIFEGLRVDVVDTASDASSMPFEINLNGTPIIQVDKTGTFVTGGVDLSAVTTNIIPVSDSTLDIGSDAVRWRAGYFDNLYATSGVFLGGTNNTGLLGFASNKLEVYVSGVEFAQFRQGAGYQQKAGSFIGWVSGSDVNGVADTLLSRDESGALALQAYASKSAANLRLYGAYTDASNYERLSIGYDGTQFRIGSESEGTGSARDLLLDSAAGIDFAIAGTDVWRIDNAASGALRPATDSARDIGTSAVRVRTGYFDNLDLSIGGHLTTNGVIVQADTTGRLDVSVAGANRVSFGNAFVRVADDGFFGWSNNFFSGATADLTLYRDAADTLAQRRGTNAQQFNLYGTYTDDSNYERLKVYHDGDGGGLLMQGAGTGTIHNLELGVGSNSARVLLMTGGVTRFSAGNDDFSPGADSSYDLGTDALRWANVYADTVYFGPGFRMDTAAGFARIATTAGGVISYFGGSSTQLNSQSAFINTDTEAVTLQSSGTRNVIVRSLGGVTELRDLANAQTFNVYGTYTDASNYERWTTKFNGTQWEIGPEWAGTGVSRNIRIRTPNASRFIDIDANGNLSGSGYTIGFAGQFFGALRGNVSAGGGNNRITEVHGSASANIGFGALLEVSGYDNTTLHGAFRLRGVQAGADRLAGDSLIQGASAFASAVTNQDGGDVILRGGASATGGGSGGSIRFQQPDGTDIATIGADGTLTGFVTWPLQVDDSAITLGNTGATNSQVLTFEFTGTGHFAQLVRSSTPNFTIYDQGGQAPFFGLAGNVGQNNTAADVRLYRDAADTLAQRRGTNAQTFNVYGTYTDGSNYERLTIRTDSTEHALLSEGAGTGTALPVVVGTEEAIAQDVFVVRASANGGVVAPTDDVLKLTRAATTPDASDYRLSFIPNRLDRGFVIRVTQSVISLTPSVSSATISIGGIINPTGDAMRLPQNADYRIGHDINQVGGDFVLGGVDSSGAASTIGEVTIRGYFAGQNMPTDQKGGAVNIVGGDAYSLQNGDGGDVILRGGLGGGTGADGSVVVQSADGLTDLLRIEPGSNSDHSASLVFPSAAFGAYGKGIVFGGASVLSFGAGNPVLNSGVGPYVFRSDPSSAFERGAFGSDPVDAQNAIGFYFGTQAQKIAVYGTYTDASNYERLSIGYDGTYQTIESQAAGTGTVRALQLKAGASQYIRLSTGGAQIRSTGITYLLDEDVYFGPTSRTRYSVVNPSHERITTDRNIVALEINAGNPSGGGTPKPLYLTGGNCGGTTGDGGDVLLKGGIRNGGTRDGRIIIREASNAYNVGENVLYMGEADVVAGKQLGGLIYAQDAQTVDEDGADLIFRGGAGDGAGSDGSIVVQSADGGTEILKVQPNLDIIWNNSGRLRDAGGRIYLYSNGAGRANIASEFGAFAQLYTGDWRVRSTNGLGWMSGTSTSSGRGETFYRESIGGIGLRYDTNPITLSLYGTYTDASNYERLSIGYTGSIFDIMSEAAGSGTDRGVRLRNQSGDTLVQVQDDFVRIGGSGAGAVVEIDGEHLRPRSPGEAALGDTAYGWDSLWLEERSSDPVDPAEGESVMWQSNGTGTGDDGDLYAKFTAGGVTKTVQITDFSSGTVAGGGGGGSSLLVAESSTLSTVTPTVIASFDSANFSSCKFIVTATQGTARHSTELLCTHNGATAISVEYASIFTTSALATYEVQYTSGTVELVATGASATSTQYNVTKVLTEA
jgi:hypothetical protein